MAVSCLVLAVSLPSVEGARQLAVVYFLCREGRVAVAVWFVLGGPFLPSFCLVFAHQPGDPSFFSVVVFLSLLFPSLPLHLPSALIDALWLLQWPLKRGLQFGQNPHKNMQPRPTNAVKQDPRRTVQLRSKTPPNAFECPKLRSRTRQK